jgi:hypothetical protein
MTNLNTMKLNINFVCVSHAFLNYATKSAHSATKRSTLTVISYNIFPSIMQLIIVPFPSHNIFRPYTVISGGGGCPTSHITCECDVT